MKGPCGSLFLYQFLYGQNDKFLQRRLRNELGFARKILRLVFSSRMKKKEKESTEKIQIILRVLSSDLLQHAYASV